MEQSIVMLDRLSKRDRDAATEILTSRTVAKTYMLPDFTSDEQVDKLFCRLMDLSRREERYVRGIYVRSTLVGFLNDVGIAGGCVELGWVVHPRYHNRGYATQAVRLAIAELFAAGFDEVTAGAFEDNIASVRVMQKSGMLPINKSDEVEYRGVIHRCVYYSMKKK